MAEPKDRKTEAPVVRATARYMRVAPRKARLVAEDLRIADVHVDEGPTLKRWRARARGRAARIEKRTSHVSVALTPGEE